MEGSIPFPSFLYLTCHGQRSNTEVQSACARSRQILSVMPTRLKGNRLLMAGIILAIMLTLAMLTLLKRGDKFTGIIHPTGIEFAGSATCKSCHPLICENHLLTAHYLTSRPATVETVKGSFDLTRNTLVMNDRLKVVMERTSDGLFQSGFVDGMKLNSRPMDIVIGSGRKGQTYLYWQDKKLFQLPVSYYPPLGEWCNSPGYPTDQILFNRPIPARCVECHGTYFRSEKVNGGGEIFDPSQVMLGVACERCHGPAADHVKFHEKHPKETEGKYIVNPARLSRQQKLDNCALCHSGLRKNIKPSFSFVSGDTLDHYSLPDYNVDEAAALDVHGNQYGLLTASRCFRKSNMDCSSCHDVHVKETNDMKLFSQRCMTCHNAANHNVCTQSQLSARRMQENCIECHMPALPSSKVLFNLTDQSKAIPDLVRTHRIAVYPEQIKIFLAKINAQPN